jgi:hypothetical protein
MDTNLRKEDWTFVIQIWNTRRNTDFLNVFQFSFIGHQGGFALSSPVTLTSPANLP